NGNPIKGKPGAKPGHKASHRKKTESKKTKPDADTAAIEIAGKEIPTEEIVIQPDSTFCCGKEMVKFPAYDNCKEQIEVVENPFIRRLYTLKAVKCEKCGTIHRGSEPETLGTGLLGPRLIALLAFLKGVGHMSFSGLERFLAINGLKVCSGFISKCLDMCSSALERPYNLQGGSFKRKITQHQ
ncbi:MAG: hypothetical protein LBF97_07180, partial [Elusimicrobiota bacterium]|nr:hypothetical protein [Elusimicrobiota bacterium]